MSEWERESERETERERRERVGARGEREKLSSKSTCERGWRVGDGVGIGRMEKEERVRAEEASCGGSNGRRAGPLQTGSDRQIDGQADGRTDRQTETEAERRIYGD